MLEGECINNQYYLQQFLGAGGFGAVYRADDVVADRPTRSVAIKLILIQDLNRQFQELHTAVNLNHANLLRCFAPGETTLPGNRGRFLFLVMELANRSLEQFQGAGVITPDVLRPIVRDVARGLEALHQEKRIHRDLKPGNVLQVGQTWKIGDFGLVRQINSQASHDSTADLAGTPMYVPPEAFRGQVSTAWDMWSLGVMIVYGLTRELPYRPFNTLQELQQRIMNCQLQIPRLASPYREIVAGCLRRDRQRRWTATQVLEAMGEVNQRSSGIRVPRRWVLGVLLTSGFVTALVMQPRQTKPPTEEPTATSYTPKPTATSTPKPTATETTIPNPPEATLSTSPAATPSQNNYANLPRLNGEAIVEMVVNGQTVTITLIGKDAPITAGNFIDLVSQKVYDGLPFHRVAREPQPFVVQGGDPQGKDPNFPATRLGTGGYIDPTTKLERNIPLEILPAESKDILYGQTFKMAGLTNATPKLKHLRGAVAMARSQFPDSASSQFYIALADLAFLDGDYAVFGYVTEGMEVVDQIQQGDRIDSMTVVSGLGNLVKPNN
jgi:peptidyl-prolyl cis-trans isomerase B (cyclophilin B)